MTTPAFDVRRLPETTRTDLAWTVHEHENFRLPVLQAWNYDLCRRHRHGWDREFRNEAGEVLVEKVFDRPFPGCRECGIHFRKHQHVSIMWLYLRKNALLADTMGSGKTTSAGGLVAMLRETGELTLYKERGSQFGGKGRVIIVPRAPALRQWRAELLRMMPDLNILIAEGPRKDRRQRYAQEWEVLLIGPEMLREDHEHLERFDLSLLLTDDIDSLRNPDTETYFRITRIGKRGNYGNSPTTDRFVVMTGTPLQKRLPELWAIFDAIAPGVLGGRESFFRRYVKTDRVTKYDANGNPKSETVITGYRNTDELKRLIAPYYLRRTADDLDDVELPTILPNDVFLDLYPAQRDKYTELRKGVLEIIRADGNGTQIKRPEALARLHYGSAICAGLAALGEEDAPRTSVKLDWVQEQLVDGDLSEEKVVIFANLKNTVRALQQRLLKLDIGFVTVWGDERSPEKRFEAQERFWKDPRCRVLIGTKAIEQSLNLQVARHLINIDMILNPARMEQLAGRIRRDGSQYQHVYVHNLLTIRTQEEGYLPLLEREAALASHIWDDNSQLFNAISPLALLQLIGQSG